jgi:hypothetical protein
MEKQLSLAAQEAATSAYHTAVHNQIVPLFLPNVPVFWGKIEMSRFLKKNYGNPTFVLSSFLTPIY